MNPSSLWTPTSHTWVSHCNRPGFSCVSQVHFGTLTYMWKFKTEFLGMKSWLSSLYLTTYTFLRPFNSQKSCLHFFLRLWIRQYGPAPNCCHHYQAFQCHMHATRIWLIISSCYLYYYVNTMQVKWSSPWKVLQEKDRILFSLHCILW